MAIEDREAIETRIQEGMEQERQETRRQMKRRLRREARGFHSDFRKFITKGNVIDLAVAVVIGQAFNKIVNGVVTFIISPLISRVIGGINMTEWKYILKEAVLAEDNTTVLEAEIAIQYGSLLQAVIDFLIIAFGLFIALRVIKRIKTKLNEKELAESAVAEAKKKAEADQKAEEAKKIADARAETERSFYEDIHAQRELLTQILDRIDANRTEN